MRPMAAVPRREQPGAFHPAAVLRGPGWLPTPAAARPAEESSIGVAPAKPGVLVVEDEPLVRFLVCDTLEAAGFDVVDAPDADRALQRFDRACCRVLVTDLNLGRGPDGLALAAEACRRSPALSVLFVTGNPERVPPCRAARPAGCCVLGKPFRCADLVARVRFLMASPPAGFS